MTKNSDLFARIEREIDQLELRISQLGIDDENFSDWFDSHLFSQDASNPSDYINELRRQLANLRYAATASRSEWLSEHLAHQLSALHQAVRWFEQRTTR